MRLSPARRRPAVPNPSGRRSNPSTFLFHTYTPLPYLVLVSQRHWLGAHRYHFSPHPIVALRNDRHNALGVPLPIAPRRRIRTRVRRPSTADFSGWCPAACLLCLATARTSCTRPAAEICPGSPLVTPQGVAARDHARSTARAPRCAAPARGSRDQEMVPSGDELRCAKPAASEVPTAAANGSDWSTRVAAHRRD